MKYLSGFLRNTVSGRFHPICFRRAPLPGGVDEDNVIQRYKSKGHHSQGFDTLEAAQQWVQGRDEMEDTGFVWDWDGADVPAMVEWFPVPQPKKVLLLSELSMTAAFMQFISAQTFERERRFYEALLSTAGQEVFSRELFLLFVVAMSHHSKEMPFNITQHLRAMVSDKESEVLAEALASLERIAGIQEEKRPYKLL